MTQLQKSLTAARDREQHFAMLVAAGTPLRVAAVEVGFSQKTAGSQASQLLKRPQVASAVERYRAQAMDEASKELRISVEGVLRRLVHLSIQAEAAGQYGPAVAATKLVGEHLGVFEAKGESSPAAQELISLLRAGMERDRAKALPEHGQAGRA